MKVALAILTALIATPVMAQAPPTHAPGQHFRCDVRAVHDGDTFTCLDGTKVRLWGVDAPELKTSAGPLAARSLALLISGEALDCQKKGTSYDRTVGKCDLITATGRRRDIAEVMVRWGEAVDWPRYSHGYYAKHSKGSRK